MISISEAKTIIEASTMPLEPVLQPLLEAASKILAADVCAPIDLPSFPQSSVDGYAFSFRDTGSAEGLPVEGAIAAGSKTPARLVPGTTVRIFTGAPVPEGADSIVMQEKTALKHGKLFMMEEGLVKGMNLRPRGTEIKNGDLALKKGTVLSAASLGYLAALGVEKVSVIPHPRISIIVTGNEIQEPGKPLAYGQVYDANSMILIAAIGKIQLDPPAIYKAADNLNELTEVLKNAITNSDLVLLTGGVSVGDFDFVPEAARQSGVNKLFHSIQQKPGKPLYFGKKENKLIFGLPGNPSSVLTCFYEYVLPAISKLTGRSLSLKSLIVPLKNDFVKKIPLGLFLKGRYQNNSVEVLDAQESYRLSSFANGNCLVLLDESVKTYVSGQLVEIHLLPE